MKKILLSLVVFLFSVSANAGTTPAGFADMVEKLSPAVVNISTTQTIDGAAENPLGYLFQFEGPDGSPLGQLPDILKKFYGMQGGEEGNGIAKQKSTSLGSGFIISDKGYIVTNSHVIEHAESITVIFSDNTEVQAKLIGKDNKTDIAILKVDTGKTLAYLNFGDSDKARVGDWVVAIGNPFGLGGSVSAGIISARARDINSGPFDDFIQTDAAINRGNSGGPLFDTNGDVIGINSAIFSPSGGNVGIGFAVPSNMAEPIIKQLIEKGHIDRGWLGVKIQTVTDDIAESLGLKKTEGALVLDVEKDSPASRAGFKSGDVILNFDDKDVETMRKLPRIVAETKIGKKVPVVIWRAGKEQTLLVTIEKLDESKDEADNSGIEGGDSNVDKFKASATIVGIGIKNIDSDDRKGFNISNDIKGVVVVDVDPKSDAAQKPIKQGDVITSINQHSIADVKEAESVISQAISDGRKSVLLLVKRGDDNLFVAVSIDKK